MRGLPSSGSYKLTRPRTSDSASSPSLKSPRSPPADDNELPIRASFEDLKRPEARQLLREQLTGTFPETTRKTSFESARNINMQLKDKLMRRSSTLEVGANASAQSSSSTVDSVGAKRLSVVPEKDNQAIDIERAIALLQELKKTASPNELVALHRALLPTKDVETVSSPKAATFDERSAFSPAPAFQRRSVLPPGLATRGGVAEDLLRKQADGLVQSQKPKSIWRNGWVHHSASASGSSLAALDLARDDGTSLAGGRAVTPSDFAYSHTGAYEPGTLRITNGAASPEPSITTAISHDRLGDDSKADDGYYTCSSGRPSLEAIRGRASIDILPGRNVSQDSLPIRDRIMNSDKAQQQRKQRSSRLSGISSASEESLVPLPQAPLQVSTTLPTQNVDRDSVSSMSDCPTPRFQQRWSHRASQISAEYVADCDITGSPYEEKNNALLNFASRLSTVYDSDDADNHDGGRGTAEAALSKLNGGAEGLAVRHSAEIGSARTSDEQIQPPQIASGSRPAPRKVDSGYGSDASLRLSQRKGSGEAGPGRNPYLASIDILKHVEEKDETASIAGAESLYTFEEILKSPILLSNMATTPSPKSTKSKKSSPLLRLHTLKSEKRSSGPSTPEPVTHESTDSIPTIASTQSSPAEGKQQAAKQQKKLQKPMPAAIKKQRKEEMRKLKEASAISLPTVPDDMSAAHAQRLEELSGGALARTYATIGTTDLQEDLDRAPPVELVGDVKFPSPAPSVVETKDSSSRLRSKSRGRERSNSVRKGASGEESPEVQRSWSIGKLRRKSQSRTRSQSQKRSSFDIVMGKSRLSAEPEERAVSPGDDNIPAFSDFSSVARTLGSGSYDISTNQFKRSTAPVSGATQHQIQSPWMISTGLIKPKSMKGMNSEMASELARMKSRDFAHADMDPSQDRPRMVFAPKSKKTRSASNEASRSTVSVEDRFPEWQGKPAAREGSPQRPQVLHRPHSMYAESIPPMPELPADVEVKASKANEIVAKKLRDGTRSSPGASARNSAEVPQGKSGSGKKSSMQSVKQAQSKQADDKTLEMLHPANRPAAGKRAHTINVEVRELNGSTSELSSAGGAEEQALDDEPIASPTHNARHSGWPGWEQQAKLWRQRRESLGETLGKPVEEDALPQADSPPMSRKPSMEPARSPAIVVSRYITPLGSDNAARANASKRPTDAAARHADSYRGLIVDDKENRPAKRDVPRTDSAVSAASTSSFVTVKSWDPRLAKQDVPRTDSAISAKTYRTTTSVVTTTSTINSERSPVGRHTRTSSGKFVPYSPTQQSAAERSRALSLAKLNGSAPSNASTQSLGWLSGSPANASTSTLGSPRGPRPQKSSPQSLTDRYSGGLDYGWERGVGFNGSAGTRSSGSEAKRKSVQMSEDFGLDLSDVPVFLQKVR
ncbi:hypothetical protein LTR85_003990 [Meristemomyces frigidus]|nr:hypothetical protein LTR85_003990 [Meristemomyces frigidus]